MIEKNPNYRPNPSRAIYIDGLIDDQLLSRLTPQILNLQSQARTPVTLYILNSPGGQVNVMQNILRMLQLPDQDSSDACRLITVVTTKAQSAAADLLSSGDYAIALRDSTLLYHGVRVPGIIPALQPLIAERTSLLAHVSRLTNNAYAMELARRTESRFMLRFVILRSGFQKIRDTSPEMSDLNCFMQLLSEKLSAPAKKVFKKAQERYARYEPLYVKLKTQANNNVGPQTPAKVEARLAKAIVDFEVESHKNELGWTFKDGGLTRLLEDFLLMAEYIEGQQTERLKHWCLSLGRFSLSKQEISELELIADVEERNEKLIEKVQPPLQPLWMFSVALCHTLQEDDNELGANDAYWLGLVDEVMGNETLLTLRMFEEYKEDETLQEQQQEKKELPAG